MPAPAPGNPEYLIRTVVFIPDDRWIVDPLQRALQMEELRKRLEVLYVLFADYLNKECAAYGFPARVPNFERDTEGKIIFHAFHGAHDHRWYYGDQDGDGVPGDITDTTRLGYNIDGLTKAEILASNPGGDDAFYRKTILVLFSDCLEYLPNGLDGASLPNIVGLVGFGGQLHLGAQSYGGHAHVSKILLDYLPSSTADWQQRLCDGSNNHPMIGGGPIYWGQTPIPVARILSEQLGTFMHEFLHAFGLLHSTTDPGIDPGNPMLATGWTAGGSAVRRTNNLPDCEDYPLSLTGAELRRVEATQILPSPYLTTSPKTDFRDPRVALAWPRLGTIIDATRVEPRVFVRAEDLESGINCFAVARSWRTMSTPFSLVGSLPLILDTTSLCGQILFPVGDSSPDFQLQVNDLQGNMGYSGVQSVQCFIRWPSQDGVRTDMLYVDRSASDDSPTAPEGSFNNPYQNIQSAINAAASGQAVVLLPGVYPLTASLQLKDGVSLIGFGSPDEIIVDGGGGSFPLITMQGYTAFTVANMTLRNASQVAVRGSMQYTLGTEFCNLIVHDITSDAIRSGIMWNLRVENCTFHAIGGAAIRFTCILDSDIQAGRFHLTNNIFSQCATGIATQGLALVANPVSECISYNLFSNTSIAVSFAGSPRNVLSYTGHQVASPDFEDADRGDFHLKRTSKAIRAGSPFYLDDEGRTPRSLGALEFTGLLAVRNPAWMMME